MIRKLLAVLVGLLVGAVSISLLENAGHLLYPPPAEFDTSDPKQLEALLTNLPAMAFLIIIASHGVGSFLAGLVATKIGRGETALLALLLGLMFTLGGVSNLYVLPYHPMWFAVLDTLIYLPLAYLGFRAQNSKVFSSQKDD